MPQKSKSVYVTMHKTFVREGIAYNNDTFNSVTLPRGTTINGQDVSFYEFSPKFVNESLRGEDWRDIPLLEDREVWLRKTIMGDDGQPVRNPDGTKQYDTIIVMPRDIKSAIDQQRQEYLDSLKGRSLHERADVATREAHGHRRQSQQRQQELADQDIPF